MAEYRKVQLYRFARNPVRETAEARFWNAFRGGERDTVKHSDQVTDVAFAPGAPHNFAAASSARLYVYGGSSGRLVKTVTRFKDKAYGPAFRHDGRLLASGSEDSLVRVFDVKGREVLRTFRGHKRAVRATAFSADGTEVFSASDDATARLWSLPTGEELLRLDEHTDYVRVARRSAAAGSNLWFTGSYDHTVRCWDPRAGEGERCVLRLDHGAPVEDVLALAGGSLVASAGANRLKVWDVLSGRVVYECSNHQKTITALAQDSGASRLVSASLDHMVKFYDLADFSVTHSLKFAAPILSMGLSPSNRILAVGMADGGLAIRRRDRRGEAGGDGGVANKRRSLHLALGGDPGASTAENEATVGATIGGGLGDGRSAAAAAAARTGTYKYYMRGHQHKAADDDLVVEAGRKPRLMEHDRLLKRFQYHEALDAAMRTNHAVIVCSVMGELSERGGLRKALAGRDEAALVPVLRFLNRNVCNPHYAASLLGVANTVLDLYGQVLGRSVAVDELFVRLRRKLAEEAAFQKQLLQLSGTLDMMMSAAAASGHGLAAGAPAPGDAHDAAQATAAGDDDAAVAAAEQTPRKRGGKRSRRSRRDEDGDEEGEGEEAAPVTPKVSAKKAKKAKKAAAKAAAAAAEAAVTAAEEELEQAERRVRERDSEEGEPDDNPRTPVQLRTRSARTPKKGGAAAAAPDSVRRSTRKRRKAE